jgi:hypothetical protein
MSRNSWTFAGPAVHLVSQRAIDSAGQVARDVGAQLADRGETERRKLFRVAPGHDIMQRRAQRVDIAARIGDSLVLLRRREAQRPDHRALARRLEEPRDSEVHQHDPPVLVSITLDGFMSR